MWILSQDKRVLTNGKVRFYYDYQHLTINKYCIFMSKEFDNFNERLLGTYNTLDEAKEAFDKLVKRINLRDCVVKVD